MGKQGLFAHVILGIRISYDQKKKLDLDYWCKASTKLKEQKPGIKKMHTTEGHQRHKHEASY
jgi:hypothetical protein